MAAALVVLAAAAAVAACWWRPHAGPVVCLMSLTVVALLSFSYRPPAWLSLLGAVTCAVVLAVWLAVVVTRRGSDGGGDDGGLGVRRSGPDPWPTDGGEPWWWPEFERDLRAYARAQERRRPHRTLRRP